MGIFRFNDPYYDLFDSTIYPLIETHTGLVCHDARYYYEAQTIKMDHIARMIEESHLVIIEISENKPNVFIEFGIAYCLHKPMIILCNIKSYSEVWENNLPFDLQGRELLKYRDKVDLRVQLGRYIFDALYNTAPTVLSWKSRHPYNHINSNSEIRLFKKEEVWSDRVVHPAFTLRYHVEILKLLEGINPDIRLFLSSESNANPKYTDKGYPRIVIIFPWELSEKTASE